MQIDSYVRKGPVPKCPVCGQKMGWHRWPYVKLSCKVHGVPEEK